MLDHLHGFLRHLLAGQLHFFCVDEILSIANNIIGLCAEVDEINHSTKNTRVRLMQAYIEGRIDATDYFHSVLRVTLKHGDKYILDLTGAQYGWQEIVTPYDIYQQSKIRLIEEVLPFWGHTSILQEESGKYWWDGRMAPPCRQRL